MEPSRNEPRLNSFSGTEDWHNRPDLNTMSISELISKLRDSFRQRDFDIVEETLIAREAMWKAEIEEKKRELELSEERMKFEKLERVTLEFKMEKLQAEMNKKALMKKNDNVGAVKNRVVGDDNGDTSAGAVKNRVVGDDNGGAIMAKEKKRDDEPRKNRLHASVVRKTTLKKAIEEKVVGKLQGNSNFKSWGRIDVEIEVNTTTKKRRREELLKVGENGKAGMGHKKCKFDVLKNRGFGDGKATATGRVGEKVDVLDETLVVREVMLKSSVEEAVGELEENNHFKSLGRIDYEIEVKTVVGESWEFGLDDGKFVKTGVGLEKSKFEVLKNRGVGDGEALAPAELAGEKVKVLAEKKRFVGASDTVRECSSGAVQKNLDTRLAKPIAIPPGDVMRKAAIAEKIKLLQKKNQFKCPGRLNFDGEGDTVNGESCGEKLIKVEENGDEKVVNAKLGHERCKLEVLKNSEVGNGEASASTKDVLGSSDKKQKNSSGAVQENPATKLVGGSIGIKRQFPLANMNFLDDIISSDSSSSSDEFDFDIPPFISSSNKKMRVGK